MRIVERNTPPVLPRVEPVEEKHLWDYVRVVYKRRWVALPAFLLIFVFMTMNSMRQTPLYRSQVQLLIEKDAPTVTSLDQMFQSQDGWFNDEFYQTQHRILQSRTLAKRTIDLMKLWDAPKLGNGPDVRGTINPMAVVWSGIDGAIALAKRPFVGETAAPAPAPTTPERPSASENASQAARISEFLGALSVVPVRNTRLVEIRYVSTDPVFAAQAANAVAEAYIQQTMEFRASTSKEAGDFLGEQLDQQRKAVEASERALQEFKEQNGAVSINDGNSSITMQRLTELNVALIKARTERISKEALYNQLKAMQANGTIDTFPAVLANDYIQGLKTNLNELQRQHAQLGERLGENNPRFVESRSALQSAQAKLTAEINKVVEGVSNEYRAAAAQEQSLQAAMNSQQGQMMGQNKMGVQYTVLQRDADSNRQIYENLLQRAKEAGISGERRTTNVRVIDQAEVPGGAFHPNVRSDMTFAFMAGLVFAFALAFGFEYLDNRIKTPQELKANINVPFLGMVPTLAAEKDAPANPLLNNGVPQNFAEAFKSIRTNVLFSTAEEGMRTLVVTSAGPGEGKSLVASNLAMALAQAGQRVLLVDCDMRRPRVHEIFEGPQEPGLSNVLSGNAKTSEAIRKASLPGLWLMPAGHIPPNPAELLAARRFNDLMTSLDTHFDWVVLDTPPVMVVADSSIVANQASGVVFVVRADKTTKQSVRAAAEQLDAANAHLIGSVLNGADVLRNPYYYSAYYRKDYARYYVASSSKASAGGRG
jgi:succinoglycan biosynthesis transport protein ExoP